MERKFNRYKLNIMNQKLYYVAYKFMKFRANKKNPFIVFENINLTDKEKIIKFLSYNHQIKFI